MIRATLPATCDPFKGRKCHYIIAPSLTSLGEFARSSHITSHFTSQSWDFNLGLEKAISYCSTGDTSCVEQSDALLVSMESHTTMPSTRSTWIDDVTGAFPNIPAFISGQPLNMRYRTRTQSESAPLAIMVDLGISASITSTQAQNRGIAILALTRALAAHRPIELWALDFGGADESQGGSWHNNIRTTNAVCVAAKIETSPLDLATSCYALAHPAFVRQVLFGLERKYHDFQGGWPFRLNRALTRLEMESLLAPLFTHVSSTLCLPGLHLADESMTAPLTWLTRQLSEHDPLKLEEV